MFVNDTEFQYSNPGHVYGLHEGKVGGSLVGQDIINFFTKTMYAYETYLEIGSWDGISISYLAEAYPKKKFYAVDCFGGYGGRGHFEYFCENNKLLNNVFVYPHSSMDVLPELLKKGYTFDLIFIDGDHGYEIVTNDLEYSWKMLNPGGRIYMHDSDHPGIIQPAKELAAKENISMFPMGESGMINFKKDS